MLSPAVIASAVSVVDSGQEDLQPPVSCQNRTSTIAVDAQNPFVPMGTRIIMNGIEYTVEDTRSI